MSKTTLPSAWVCTNDPKLSYKNHGRRAVQHNKIYLKDGEEFEIELFNPMSENVLAIISLDGKQISSSGLVIRSGQRCYLDCFYDDLKKFVFKTYEIEDSKEAKAAVAKNGLLEIQFFKEKILKKYDVEKIVEIHHHHYPYYRPYWYGTTGGIYLTNGTTTIGQSTTTVSTNYLRGSLTNTSGITASNSVGSTAISNNMNLSDYSSSFTGSSSSVNLSSLVNTSNVNTSDITLDSLSFSTTSLETGQVDKGADSDQKFESVDMDFEDNVLNKLSYQLLPESRKPVDIASFENKKIVLNADEIELNGNVKINGNSSDKVSKLLQLKEMLKEELISKEEFEKFKKEL